MADVFDVAIVGGGPAGYVAAIRAAQLGLRPALIEKEPRLGGTCVRVGCIPTKALLESSERYEQTSHDLAAHGVLTGEVRLDLATMLSRKDKIVEELCRGLDALMKKNKITRLLGTGRITAPDTVVVTGADGSPQTVQAKHLLIATGSQPVCLPGLAFDGQRVLHSSHALTLDKVPGHLIVIGAGVIGLELGSVWRRLGAQVTLVEMLPGLLPGLDAQVARMAQRTFIRQGLVFKLGTRVEGVEIHANGVRVKVCSTAADAQPEVLEGDAVLVSIGRRPYTEGLGLEALGVTLNAKGQIQVNERYETNVAGVYAVGDVIPGPMLAHKASEEALAAIEIMAGHAGQVNMATVPAIVYTWPEVAWVGRSEEDLQQAGVLFKTGTFNFLANGRAKTMGVKDGIVKVLAHAETDQLLGVALFGPHVSELIHEAVMAMEFGGSAEDLALAFHGHPTLAEALREAALGVAGRTIHA